MAKTINGKVYDDNWKYLWHEDIVYGTGPIWKNQERGLTQNLNSEATTNSQPTKDMNAWTGTIKYADPQSPSTNPATRREKYATSTGSTTPENDMLTTIWWYQTTTPTQIETPKFTQTDTTTPTSWIIKDKGSFSYGVQWGDSALELIKKSLEEAGVDATAEMYWPLKTKAVQDYLSSQYALGELMNQQTWILNKQSPNVQRVIDLAEEVAMARALWINDAATIAKQLNQEERVIQKIMNGEANELVQLNQDYVDKQLKDYIRAGEDYTTNIQRNIVQFQNAKQNLDYQFNSAMDTIERQLFDSERAAKTSSAIFWMTGTKYTIDRIRTQYQQQMDDLQNTYDYQSATAQLAINNALEDYSTNMMRLTEDYDEAYKVVQQNVLATMQNLNNQVWLTIKQQSDILTNLQTNVAQMKADALSTYLAWLEAGNQAFSDAVANAYGLDTSSLGTHQFTSQELGRTSTSTIWNDTNNLWHILASDDWTRIWTYKSPNWYTYNVYATREDWLLATQWLLQRAYYGKTLKDAAQKRIWQGKDISWALAVLEELKLDPNAILSDENVRKFMEAIGRREGTLKKGETLDDWVKWWKDLSWYWTSSDWWEIIWWNYDRNYVKDYDRYLENWRDSFKKSTQDSLIQQFWSMDNFIKNAQEYSEAVVQPQQIQTFQDSLDIIVEFNKAWNKLSDRQRWLVKKLWVKDSYQNWLYSDDVNNAVNLYKQLMAQWFIQNIIDSKKKWATYGPLSDNEWGEIKNAYSSMKLNAPEYVQWNIDYMIYDLFKAITELWWTPDIESWLQRDISYLYNNSNAQTEFNTPGSAYTWADSVNNRTNSQWAYQSWTVNTWATQMWWN